MISLLCPEGKTPVYRTLSETVQHDLALDWMVMQLSELEKEQNLIRRFMSQVTDDPEVAEYRCEVFADLLANPSVREEMVKLLDQISFMKDYGSFKRDYDKAGIWDLMHRLDEIRDYIRIIEAVHRCLDGPQIRSAGMKSLKEYADGVYADAGFARLKEDISRISADTAHIRSVTIGINLNERMEADSVGLVSVNSKPFTRSGMISSFAGFLQTRDQLQEDTEWKDNYHYQQISDEDVAGGLTHTAETVGLLRYHPLIAASMLLVNKGDETVEVPHYLQRVMDGMLSSLVKKLRRVLSQHVKVSIADMALLIPEFTYYIRWTEYIEKLQAKGMHFCRPQPRKDGQPDMHSRGFYNLKLTGSMEYQDIVVNDLDFDPDHRIYILTGANRGGKTTATQAIGQLYLLAQGGISVPADSFVFAPVDAIYTHFPADEDKTMDLGRLGEECRRFREIYQQSSRSSLILLNETFSTTSFEEGYYIAFDAVRALRDKGVRTIYNTHMHKLGYDVDKLNADATQTEEGGRVASLIMETEETHRTYHLKLAPPEGSSYAQDIARKYGVTYEMLLES